MVVSFMTGVVAFCERGIHIKGFFLDISYRAIYFFTGRCPSQSIGDSGFCPQEPAYAQQSRCSRCRVFNNGLRAKKGIITAARINTGTYRRAMLLASRFEVSNALLGRLQL